MSAASLGDPGYYEFVADAERPDLIYEVHTETAGQPPATVRMDLLDRQVITGVETAFRMILMAVALAAGLLLSRVISPERRMR